MSKKNEMLELLNEEREIRENRIIAEKEGEVFANFHDAAVLNNVAAYDGGEVKLMERNPDGSVASTGKTIHAMNPDFYFLNRYKVKGTGKQKRLWVVSGHTADGFRCIQEQSKGRCFIKTIPCSVVMRDDDGNLVLDTQTTIPESEFISGFTKTLDNPTMAEILPLIVDKGNELTADSMPI